MTDKWPAKWDEQNPLMLGTFVGFLLWASAETDFPREWQERTGKRLPTGPRSPLDAMIDKATGYDKAKDPVVGEFIQAVYEELWAGEPEEDEQ